MITVVGIGIERGDITTKGKKAVKNATKVYSRVKTYIKSEVLSSSFVGEDYARLDEHIVNNLINAEKSGEKVVYLALGDGFTDTAVKLLSEKTQVEIIAGVSEYRGRTADSEVVFLSAYDALDKPTFDTALPIVVYGIDDKFIAGELKLALSAHFGDETECVFASGKKKERIALYELDRQKKYDGACVVLKGERDFLAKNRYGFSDLIAVMRRLTAPDGCPWDKAQTHESIRVNMLEEAYEVVDAIDSGDIENLREELGDVLLQVVFNCDIAGRTGEFTLSEVISELVHKLVFRHTHIFGKNKAENASEALDFWEKAKAEEKSYSTLSEQLSRVPDSFPALLFAQKIYKKSKKGGVVFPDGEIEKKLDELVKGGINEQNASKLLLYATMAVVNLGLDAEVELSKTAKEFACAVANAEEKGSLDDLHEEI